MRWIWIALLFLFVAAGAALWLRQEPSPSIELSPPAPPPVMESTDIVAPVRPEPEPDAAKLLAAELVDSANARSHEVSSVETNGEDGSSESTPTSTSDAALLDLGLDLKIASSTVQRGRIVRNEDGTLRADDRFTIRGAGTAQDPYRISWELLLSAQESYQPRLGQTAIPQRIALLHGARVRIEGYAAFPVFSFDPTEMLMMLNQWDGCCIGVPPTPFDAIEIKLSEAPRERRRQTAYFGAVEGVLRVEPYLVESWLVGLYLMDEGKFSTEM